MTRPPADLETRPTRLLEARVRAFFRHLPAALAGHEESVHQMRVTGRRVRIALPLLAMKPEGRRVRRARRILRGLIRTAAACRDLDVCLALFDAHLGARAERPDLAPEIARLRRRLRAARARSRRRMTEGLLDQDVARLRDDLRTIRARRGEAVMIVLQRLRDTRDRGGAELGSGLAALGDRFDPEALHRLRTHVRRLRYLAEVDAEIGAEPDRAAKAFKAVQERLGRIHDVHVLAVWLGRQAAVASSRGAPALVAAARELEAAFVDRARAHHRSYLEEDPAGSLHRALDLLGRREPQPLRLAR